MNHIYKEEIDQVLGKILKKYRMRNRMTQEQLSEKLGISLKYISRIENGNNGVKTQTLINYMNILGITPNTIYASFISNIDTIKDIEISEKISSLSDEKKNFINSVLDLLQNLD